MSMAMLVAGHEPFNLNNFEGIDDFESLFWTNPLQDHIEIGGATKENQTKEGGLKSPSSTSGFAEDIEKFLLDDEFALPEQNGIKNNATDSTAQPNEGCESSIPHPSALSDQEFLESWLNFLGSESPRPTSLDDQPVHDSMGGDWNF
ncbi:hypothetical protein QJS10_CPB17g01097 [Acorus calamus]|uniref:Uncharacterized protein n=1 Tax=Acorus calamus TaxID=4465 RepID=A0AAV9CSB0_ACOCL|nr:hypothetical protein QJS10_CPB17g01097 [Acorus calamus]